MADKKFIFLVLIAVLLTIGIFVSASYELKDKKYEIQESYNKGENIKGWINISFSNESAVSVFSDGIGNSISLIGLLKTDLRHKYSCAPNNCESSYSATAPGTSKQIILNAGEEKLIGFVFDQNIDSIENFSLSIISNAVKSKDNQLKIDLFNDGTNDIGNTKTYNQTEEWSAPKDFACFDYTNPAIQEVLIKGGNSYCQRINLPEAPGYTLGAWLKKASSADSLTLKMNLYDPDLDDPLAASCDIGQAITTQETPVYCDVKYLVTKQKDYYVCLSAQGSGTYKMKAHTGQCGFFGTPPQDEIGAYKIFSQPRYFDAIGTLEILDKLPTGESSSYLSELYIEENYDNLSCAGRKCIVPIKLISNVAQNLTLSGKIEYKVPGFGTPEIYTLHDLSQSSAKITANAQKIYLDKGNFTTPNNFGRYLFNLSLGNSELFVKEVEVKKGVEIISVNPVKTAAGLPTNFKVKINANNITIAKYKWDFNGDGLIDKTTLSNVAEHTYNSTINYNLIISVEDSEGTSSSESFNIEVGSAKEVLDDLIIEKQENLLDIRGAISAYDLSSIEVVKNILNLNDIEKNLSSLSAKYNLIKDSGTETQFQNLLSDVLKIELPKSLSKNLDSVPLTFFPKKENINLNAIETIAGGNYDADLEEEYKEALLTWNLNNVKTKISAKEYSAIYDSGEEPLVNVFKLDIKDLGAGEDYYIFVKTMEGINFKENFSYDDSSGYYYNQLTGDENLEFYTTENINFESLPVFISPYLDALSVIDTGTTPEKAGKKFKWSLFALIIIFVIILGIVVYFILKKWYKDKYENYLFKNKNDLYNIVTFVHSSKQHGKDAQTISRELRKSGWSNEQVNYVMKKYSGKHLGMLGFSNKPSIR